MPDLDRLFYPRSVAVVGVSKDPRTFGGRIWIKVLLELGFEGMLYPINPTMSEFNGLKVYSSIEDVPDSIDLVICSVPAESTPQLMEECVHKAVGFAQVFTAGFSELGSEGVALEKEFVRIAGKGGVRVVGPNCMGVYCPQSHFCWRSDFPRESGAVAFLSQSGFNAAQVAKIGAARELYFSKLISYGNAADLNETDFLEYFTTDPETKVITMYIEGVKDGQRFIKALREATRVKPVIVLKGGRSASGARAAISHTAALAGSTRIWESLFRQAGAVEVRSFEELIDTAMAFLCLPALGGANVALIGTGGGISVMGADQCEDAGLRIVPLPGKTEAALSTFSLGVGTSLKNPLDIPFEYNRQPLQQIIAMVASCTEIASIVIHLDVDAFLYVLDEGELTKCSNTIIAAARDCSKPIAVVLMTCGLPEAVKASLVQQRLLLAYGIPVYPTVARAARAISRVLQYQRSGR